MTKYQDDLWDISDIKSGTILRDWFDEGIRVIIMRGPASMNVYMGIPEDHPLAGFDYDSISIDCHGGLTFSSKGTELWPKGYWWFGYDYAHAGDSIIFDNKKAQAIHEKYPTSEKKWTLGEIKEDTWSPICELKKLMKLAEQIKIK